MNNKSQYKLLWKLIHDHISYEINNCSHEENRIIVECLKNPHFYHSLHIVTMEKIVKKWYENFINEVRVNYNDYY